MKVGIIAHLHPNKEAQRLQLESIAHTMISMVREGNPQTPPKITVLKRRDEKMGSHANIKHDKFPEQSKHSPVGSRVSVCFHYDTDHRVDGTVVRNDAEEPFITIFALDNGHHVLATECQYQPKD